MGKWQWRAVSRQAMLKAQSGSSKSSGSAVQIRLEWIQLMVRRFDESI